MNIIKQDIDETCALLKVQIVKTDYEEAAKKSLNAYRRKVEIKGFRQGMAPLSLVQKIYGRAILADEIEKLIIKSLENYLEDENLQIMGEPIPCEAEQKPLDLDSQSDFEFVYEIGYTPKYELKIDKTIKVPFYNIRVNDSDIREQMDIMRQNYSTLEEAEIIDENSLMTIDINQDCENAIKAEDILFSLRWLKTQEQKKPFSGLKVGDTIAININELYSKDEDKAEFLGIKKEKLNTVNPEFNFTVKTIRNYKKADVNQEFFDAVYGQDTVKNEEEFLQKLADDLKKTYEEESNYKFTVDLRKELIEKAGIKFPESFLKKWLLLLNDDKKITAEDIDKEFDIFMADLNWQTIRDNIAKENDIKVEDADIKNIAMAKARLRLIKYGFNHLPENQIEGLAQRLMNNKEQHNDIVEKALDNKVFEYLKTAVQLDEKTINIEDFDKLLEL
ncbi:MAG: trigger factor [Prevotellaceae bacterium]|jgi:trigger factor|nr:trigger factor [Prevotellaceae bacterium]